MFCYVPKIQIKRPNLRIFCQKDANGIANSEDPDQADLRLHCLLRPVCPQIWVYYGMWVFHSLSAIF